MQSVGAGYKKTLTLMPNVVFINISDSFSTEPNLIFKFKSAVKPKPKLTEKVRFQPRFNQMFTIINIGVFKTWNTEIEIGFASELVIVRIFG